MKRLLLTLIITSSALLADRIPVKLTGPRKVRALYQQMKDMHELFGAYDIPYWIDSGTLLGAVRHTGIIPWDNDLDVCMRKKDAKNLLRLRSTLKELGYTLRDMPFGYAIKGPHSCFDIFLVIKKRDKYIYADKHTQTFFAKRDKGPIYYTEDELFPLKLYQFGALEVWGPQDPYPYLDNYYRNWNTTAKFLVDHAVYAYSPKKLRLEEADRAPAQPFGPLEERVLPFLAAKNKKFGTNANNTT